MYKKAKELQKRRAFNSFTAFYVTMSDIREKFGDVYDYYPDLVIIPSQYEDYVNSVRSKDGVVLGMRVEFSDELESDEFEMYNEDMHLGYDD